MPGLIAPMALPAQTLHHSRGWNRTMLTRLPADMQHWFPQQSIPKLLPLAVDCPKSCTCPDATNAGACTFDGAGVACGIERHAIKDIHAYLPKNSVVLELGARFGTVSCAISKRQRYSSLRMSVEPDVKAFSALKRNLKRHACTGYVVHGAVSSTPLWHVFSGRMATMSYSTRLLTTEASGCTDEFSRRRRCRRVPTFSVAELQANFSARVGRPTPFTALVIDCEFCWDQLKNDEGEFLRSPQLTHLFYELDEKNTSVIEEICSFGFGVVSAQVDCLLPYSGLAQLVFKRDAQLPCLEKRVERLVACDCKPDSRRDLVGAPDTRRIP